MVEEVSRGKCFIVILIGIPGCGKTTLAKLLTQELNKLNISVHHIEYDKEYANCNPGGDFDSVQWKISRSQSYQQVANILESTTGEAPCVIIVDDNMHFRSMRRPFFQLARNSGQAGFAQVFVDAKLQEAMARNEKRVGVDKVPDPVIRRIHACMEAPRPDLYSWEQSSVILDGTLTDIHDFTTKLLSLWGPPPQQLTEVDMEQRSRDQHATDASCVHAFDLSSRSLLQSTMQQLQQAGNVTTGKQLNRVRRGLLTEVKNSADSSLHYQCEEARLLFAAHCEHALRNGA